MHDKKMMIITPLVYKDDDDDVDVNTCMYLHHHHLYTDLNPQFRSSAVMQVEETSKTQNSSPRDWKVFAVISNP